MCTTLSPQSVFFEIAALCGYIILAAEVILCASIHIRKTVKIRNGSVYSFIFLRWVVYSHSSIGRCISRMTLDILIMEIPKSFINSQLLGVAVFKSKHDYHSLDNLLWVLRLCFLKTLGSRFFTMLWFHRLESRYEENEQLLVLVTVKHLLREIISFQYCI